MSLEQVNAFYDALTANQVIYEQYYHKCCRRGILGSCHWDKSIIVNFAASLGYSFTESDLDRAWFESEPSTYADEFLSINNSGVSRQESEEFIISNF